MLDLLQMFQILKFLMLILPYLLLKMFLFSPADMTGDLGIQQYAP